MNKVKLVFVISCMIISTFMVALPNAKAQQAPPPKPEPGPTGCGCQLSAECAALKCGTTCSYSLIYRVGYCK